MTYESVKQLTATFQGSSSPTSPGPVAVAGGLCGLVSWATVSLRLSRPPSNAHAQLTQTYRRPIPSTPPNRGTSATAYPSAKASWCKCPRSNGSASKCTAVNPSSSPAHLLPEQGAKEIFLLGLGVSMARSCITNAILFSSFEYLKKKINALQDPSPLPSLD